MCTQKPVLEIKKKSLAGCYSVIKPQWNSRDASYNLCSFSKWFATWVIMGQFASYLYVFSVLRDLSDVMITIKYEKILNFE